MATIHVDGKEYEVNGADNLLEACGIRRWEASVLAASVR